MVSVPEQNGRRGAGVRDEMRWWAFSFEQTAEASAMRAREEAALSAFDAQMSAARAREEATASDFEAHASAARAREEAAASAFEAQVCVVRWDEMR